MANTLVFDLGTTYFKGVVFNEQGEVLGLQRAPVPVEHPYPGYWELDARLFRDAIAQIVRRFREEDAVNIDAVDAISFATQTNSFVLLDGMRKPLTPIILWPDERAQDLPPEEKELIESLVAYETTGVPIISHQFMAAKLLWLRRMDPDVWSRTTKVALISDYFTFWMTGRYIGEGGASGLTGLLDAHSLQWREDALERLELPLVWFPDVMRAGTDLGPILPEIAHELQLPETCHFITGCLDQYAGAIGAGNVVPGGISETTGTVLASVRFADRFEPNMPTGVFQGPGFADGTYFQMVFGDTSANLFEAYRNSLPDKPEFEELGQAAAEVPPGAEGLRLRPNPEFATTQELVWEGKTDAHGRGHEVRAIMEAVAYALADQVDELCGSEKPSVIRSVGGAARSSIWLQIKADVLGTPFAATTCPEPTSLGGAILAAKGLRSADIVDIAQRLVGTQPPKEPNPATHETYAALRASK